MPKQDQIEKWILDNNEYFFSFFAGYVDAEGHIYIRILKDEKVPFAGLEISTYDKGILHQVWEKLNGLGIKCPKPLLNKPAGYKCKNGLINRGDCWRLSITRKESLALLFDKIYPLIKHEKRKRDLEVAWANILSRTQQI